MKGRKEIETKGRRERGKKLTNEGKKEGRTGATKVEGRQERLEKEAGMKERKEGSKKGR